MKTLFITLIASILSSGLIADNENAPRRIKDIRNQTVKDLRKVISGLSGEIETSRAFVTVLLKIDEYGKAEVVEMDTQNEGLQKSLRERFEGAQFHDLCGETVRLVVDLRK